MSKGGSAQGPTSTVRAAVGQRGDARHILVGLWPQMIEQAGLTPPLVTSSRKPRTPSLRMLPRVIGSPGGCFTRSPRRRVRATGAE